MKGARVLVVDDDPAFAEVVAEALSDRGYEVVAQTDPIRAVELAAESAFAAAVVDLVMPKLSGLQVAEQIRTSSPDTQVVIVTGQGTKESAIGGIQRGVFDFLDKGDLDFARLARSVANAVEKARLGKENAALVTRLRESNRLLRALADLGEGLGQSVHEDRLLSQLVDAGRELCAASACKVVLFEAGGDGKYVVETCVGDGVSAVGARLPEGHGIMGSVAQGAQAQVLSVARDHPRYAEAVDDLPADRTGYLCVPVRHGSVLGALSVAGSENGFRIEQRDVLAALAGQSAVALDKARQQERHSNFFTHASEMLVSILEHVDPYSQGHPREVAQLANLVARRLGLSEDERRTLHHGALLHDIGKLLLGPGLLGAKTYSEADRTQMREHPTLGMELLRPVRVWEHVLPIVYGHHERWDGTGYPRGLAGDEIPRDARIVAVADAFDNMQRDLPWAGRRSAEQALAELGAGAGTQFDPQIVHLFVAAYREVRARP